MWNTYEEIDPKYRHVADTLEKNGFSYKAYNNGIQFNAYDGNNIIQSFYPSTGTILLHRSNDRKDKATHTIKGADLDQFMSYLRKPIKTQEIFFKENRGL